MSVPGGKENYQMSNSIAKRIIPLMDRILVRRFKPVEKTASGIYIPEKAQENLNRGEVMAVGPGSTENPVTLKIGDKVILPGFGGASIKLEKGDEEFLLYRESDILAKVMSE